MILIPLYDTLTGKPVKRDMDGSVLGRLIAIVDYNE